MIAPNITARVGDGFRQAKVEALVHFNIRVVGEEVHLIAVVELDAGIQEGLDAVGRRGSPLLHGTRIIRQLRSESGKGLGESQRRRARRVANGLFPFGPLAPKITEPRVAQGKPPIAPSSPSPPSRGN